MPQIKFYCKRKFVQLLYFFVEGLWRIRHNASEGGEGKGTFVEIFCRFIDARDAYLIDNVKSGTLIPTVVKQF